MGRWVRCSLLSSNHQGCRQQGRGQGHLHRGQDHQGEEEADRGGDGVPVHSGGQAHCEARHLLSIRCHRPPQEVPHQEG